MLIYFHYELFNTNENALASEQLLKLRYCYVEQLISQTYKMLPGCDINS